MEGLFTIRANSSSLYCFLELSGGIRVHYDGPTNDCQCDGTENNSAGGPSKLPFAVLCQQKVIYTSYISKQVGSVYHLLIINKPLF